MKVTLTQERKYCTQILNQSIYLKKLFNSQLHRIKRHFKINYTLVSTQTCKYETLNEDRSYYFVKMNMEDHCTMWVYILPTEMIRIKYISIWDQLTVCKPMKTSLYKIVLQTNFSLCCC